MKRKIYEPVREFERQTSFCPLYLAWRILDEVRDYFRIPIPEAFADKLTRRAEAVSAKHPFWQRKFQSGRGCDATLMAMRHWLAGVLAKENPVLFRQVPESFKIGHLLPERPNPVGRGYRRTDSRGRSPHRIAPHFVHGCELLAV